MGSWLRCNGADKTLEFILTPCHINDLCSKSLISLHLDETCKVKGRQNPLFSRGFDTWFLKLFIEDPPGLCDPLQALLHGLDVHIRAVALWELGVTVAPAVIVLAAKFALSIAGNVAERSLHKTFPQVVWKDHLQACKTKLGLAPSSHCELGEWQWKYSGNIVLAELTTYSIKSINLNICMPRLCVVRIPFRRMVDL